MDVTDLTQRLGYNDSPDFLRAGTEEFRTAPAFGHIFRRAQERLGLHGVYTLGNPCGPATTPLVPVVYVCHAQDENRANEIHKLVWNQGVAPFVLVTTPASIRLYSGFSNRQPANSAAKRAPGLLEIFNKIGLDIGLDAGAIDTGAVWRGPLAHSFRPDDRVDWKLLGNLRQLSGWLQTSGGLKPDVAHALIGKYVYLHYLRDRDILSQRKLEKWGIMKETIFGRDATLAGFNQVNSKLDAWLNGSLFPLAEVEASTLREDHLQQVAAIFSGDEPLDNNTPQLHLDFKAYDFSYIPIETLSVIYEQFLHEPVEGEKATRGEEAAAYYTPLPLVNFMLAELNDRHPLKPGMRVLDPSCGSGAFLVQCYRRLIEQSIATGRNPGFFGFRGLLEKHIFGVDRDADACSVTELSLLLTLLDYVNPPDLEDDKRVKLPTLRDKNIFCADFFAPTIENAAVSRKSFDWIVGNPPWKKIANQDADQQAIAWIKATDKKAMPIGGKQLAQAFVWRIKEFLKPKGEVGLLLPAMTLFDTHSADFRKAFFAKMHTHSIANFSNLAEVLFAGRSRVPAAAFFFTNREPDGTKADECISAYSPLVANQEVTRPAGAGKRIESWSLTLNASEIRSVPLADALKGDGLPWKIAAWGSHLDRRLFARLERKQFLTIGDLEQEKRIVVAQGPEFRDKNTEGRRTFDRCEEAVGKPILNMGALAGRRHLFAIPQEAISTNRDAYIRSGMTSGLRICAPPHIIISEARTFAIFSDRYLIVPPIQVGIASEKENAPLLKALSLFLNSDFCFYHQFFASTHFGIQRAIAGLADIRKLPVPVAALSRGELAEWEHLHDRLVAASEGGLIGQQRGGEDLGQANIHPAQRDKSKASLNHLNELAYSVLGLSDHERDIVHDFVHTRYALNDGKVGDKAVGRPSEAAMYIYAARLRYDLDTFVGNELSGRHKVQVEHNESSGMVCVEFVESGRTALDPVVRPAGPEMGKQLTQAGAHLRRQFAQWVYFDRNLMIFEGTRTYLLKPMQQFHWTQSQAMLDAGEIIARTLAGGGEHA